MIGVLSLPLWFQFSSDTFLLRSDILFFSHFQNKSVLWIMVSFLSLFLSFFLKFFRPPSYPDHSQGPCTHGDYNLQYPQCLCLLGCACAFLSFHKFAEALGFLFSSSTHSLWLLFISKARHEITKSLLYKQYFLGSLRVYHYYSIELLHSQPRVLFSVELSDGDMPSPIMVLSPLLMLLQFLSIYPSIHSRGLCSARKRI